MPLEYRLFEINKQIIIYALLFLDVDCLDLIPLGIQSSLVPSERCLNPLAIKEERRVHKTTTATLQ